MKINYIFNFMYLRDRESLLLGIFSFFSASFTLMHSIIISLLS